MDINRIRQDFPSLQQKFNGKPVVYFDNACMTLRTVQVVEAMNEYYYKYPACHGRSVHKFSQLATEKYEEAREKLQHFIGARKKQEIVFTRNTTEGLNLVANSLDFKKGDKVLTTDKEHNSNLLPWQFLAKERGIKHEIFFTGENGEFDLKKFEEQVKDVKLVSMVYSSNLDGTTIPAEQVIKIAHRSGALVMLDGAQSVPHKEIDVHKLGIDFIAFSTHKMLGPSGFGVLYGKYELLEKLSPFLVGGDTVENTTYDSCVMMKPPEKFEAGLQNYAGAIGAGAAAEYIEKIGKKIIEKHELELNKIITDGLSEIEKVKILGPQEPEKRGGIVSMLVEGMDVHELAIILDETQNIMVRSGRHCVHSWFNAHKIDGSLRASFYLYNTEKEAELFVETLKQIIKQLG